MPRTKEKKIYTKHTRCLSCVKKRIKCINAPNSNICQYCLENNYICNRFKPSKVYEEISRLNNIIYNHEGRIRQLEFDVSLLKRENQIFKRNLQQRKLLDDALSSEILLQDEDDDNNIE